MPSCRRLLLHAADLAVAFVWLNAGTNSVARTPITAITTNSSISVNPHVAVDGGRQVGHVSPLRAAVASSNDGAHGVTRPTWVSIAGPCFMFSAQRGAVVAATGCRPVRVR